MLCVWVQLGRAMSPAYPNVRTALPMIWPASRRLQEVLPRIGLAAVGLRDETVVRVVGQQATRIVSHLTGERQSVP